MQARLSPADAAWLRLDRPENRMVVTAVLWLGGELDEAALRNALAERLAGPHPRFRSRVRPARVPLGLPVWEPDGGFDVARHVDRADLGGAGDAALDDLVGALLPEALDPHDGAPWRVLLVAGYRASPAAALASVVVVRLHHALADGAALVRLLLELTDGAAPAPGEEAARAAPRPATRRWVRVRDAARLAVAVPLTAVRLLLLRPEPRTPVRGRLGRAKGAAWVPPRPLAEVKAAARRHGATVNDVLLAAVGGGLRRYLAEVAPGTRPPRALRVFVPVDVGGAGDGGHRAGNRFGLLPMRLPVAERDPRRRLRAVAEAARRARRSPVPVASYVLVGVLGLLPGPVPELLARLLGSRASAIVTNVPGPQGPRTLAGVPVTGIAFWVPQTAEVGLGVSLFSYAGTVRIGVAADARLVPEPERLARAMDAELASLLTPAP